MKKTFLSLAVLSVLATPVMAEHSYRGAEVSYSGHGHDKHQNTRPYQDHARPSTFSVNHLEAGYAATDYDTGSQIDVESDGFYVQGRKSLGENVYVHGFYTDQDMDDFDASVNTYNVGLGAHAPLHYSYGYEVTGFIQAGKSKISAESNIPGFEGSGSDSGFTLNVGASSNLGMQGVELGLSIDHYNFDATETGFSINGAFPIHKEISLSGKYSYIDGSDLYFAGLRYQFWSYHLIKEAECPLGIRPIFYGIINKTP